MKQRTSPVHGILFDKDGTLIDYHQSFMPLNRRLTEALADGDATVAAHLMRIGGHDDETDRFRSGSPLAADTNHEIAVLFHRELTKMGRPARSLAEVLDVVETNYEATEETAVAVTDLPALMTVLKSQGINLGISTSDNTRTAFATARQFAIDGLMDFIAGYDAGFGPKPGPGIIHGFCEQHGLAPETVMVVGDNRHDIEFGRAGGVGWAVGVLTGTSGRADLEPIADIVLENISALPDLLDTLTD